MKRKLAAMVMAAMAIAAIAAPPASAGDFDFDDDGYNSFFFLPFIAVIDDVDFENVRERNDREGECYVDDVDLDGFIAEYELTCFY